MSLHQRCALILANIRALSNSIATGDQDCSLPYRFEHPRLDLDQKPALAAWYLRSPQQDAIAGTSIDALAEKVRELHGDNPDQDAGIRIVLRALEEALRQIVANAGMEPSVVLSRISEGEGGFGCNAATGEYADLMQIGVMDPTKVTRNALQNAASVAALILTTDCMIAEIPQPKSMPPMPEDVGM